MPFSTYFDKVKAGCQRTLHSAGPFSNWKSRVGFQRRVMVGVLKGLDLVTTSIKPGGTYLERLRIRQIMYGLLENERPQSITIQKTEKGKIRQTIMAEYLKNACLFRDEEELSSSFFWKADLPEEGAEYAYRGMRLTLGSLINIIGGDMDSSKSQWGEMWFTRFPNIARGYAWRPRHSLPEPSKDFLLVIIQIERRIIPKGILGCNAREWMSINGVLPSGMFKIFVYDKLRQSWELIPE